MSTQYYKRRFLINAISSSLQSVVVAATLFFLYRFLLRTIPVEHIGIWSVIFAAASVGKLAEMGISAGVVKFVASWLAKDEPEEAAHSIRTAATATSLGIGTTLGVAYILAPWVLPLLVGVEHSALALSVLALALISFWLSSIASVFQSALDGCHRMDVRSALTIGTTLLHFFLCLLLTPSMGLTGLGISQIIQSFATLLGTLLVLRQTLPALGWKFFGWNQRHFRQLLAYGMNAQLASVSITLLSEPITKAFITNVGGLSFVAYYDMATRMITQLRSVILSAFQAMVPMVSHMQEDHQDELRRLYQKATKSMSLVSLPLFSAIAGFAPIVSLLWIGHIEAAFVSSAIILAVGWCMNTLIVPAYMMNLGTGSLRWNTASHIVIGIINSVFGYVLSRQLGANGAVLAWTLGLIVGSVLLLDRFHHEHRLTWSSMFSRQQMILFLASIVVSLVLNYEYAALSGSMSTVGLTSLMMGTFLAVILPLVLRSSVVTQLRTFVGTHLAKQ